MIKFKHIFDSNIRPGDAVLSRATDETFIYMQEYSPGLTSLVRRPHKDSVPFLMETELLAKFRGYIFCQWLSKKAGILNKRLARLVHAKSY